MKRTRKHIEYTEENSEVENIKEAIMEKIREEGLGVVEDCGNGPYEHFGGTGNDVRMGMVVNPGQAEVEIMYVDEFWKAPIGEIGVQCTGERRGKEYEKEVVVKLVRFEWRVEEDKYYAIYTW